MAAMGSGFNEETASFGYTPSAEITVAVSIARLVVMGLICSFPTLWLHKVFIWFAPINSEYPPSPQAGLLTDTNDSFGICCNLYRPLSHDAKQTFRRRCFRQCDVTNGSGWNSKGFFFLIGFLSVAWTMTDYDATTHMSEETKQAAIRGLVAITQAVLISGVVGLLLNITLSFSLVISPRHSLQGLAIRRRRSFSMWQEAEVAWQFGSGLC